MFSVPLMVKLMHSHDRQITSLLERIVILGGRFLFLSSSTPFCGFYPNQNSQLSSYEISIEVQSSRQGLFVVADSPSLDGDTCRPEPVLRQVRRRYATRGIENER